MRLTHALAISLVIFFALDSGDVGARTPRAKATSAPLKEKADVPDDVKIGRASCRERVFALV